MNDMEKSVEEHYTRGNLKEAILEGLKAGGINLEALKREDLAPMDAFHIRGLEATRELTELAGLAPGMRVLDVGSGLGGSARFMAAEYGSHVTGVDLTEEFCTVATMLSEMLGLEDRSEFLHCSALDLPFEDGRFDRVWTEHVQMNISDKHRMYSEIFRVLKPGGKFMFHDVLAGKGGAALYPAPWAQDPSNSTLIAPEDLQELLQSLGLKVVHWEDCTQKSTDWFRKRVENIKKHGPPILGSHIIHGSQAKIRFENQVRNLAENRVTVVQAALEKPD
ncbi:MAG: class I SAM-dependent methyltransferase [bacterium]